MLKSDLDKMRKYIEANDWTFARTMPQWPHEYVIPKTKAQIAGFEHFMDCIEEYGFEDRWGKRLDKYLVVDGYKYWGFDLPKRVLNRAEPISCAEVQRRAKKMK